MNDMFKDKELRKQLFGIFSKEDSPVGRGKWTSYNFDDGRQIKVQQTEGVIFHLLNEIESLKNKIAGLEMSRYGVIGSAKIDKK